MPSEPRQTVMKVTHTPDGGAADITVHLTGSPAADAEAFNVLRQWLQAHGRDYESIAVTGHDPRQIRLRVTGG